MLLCLYWGINFLRGKDIFNSTNTYYAQYDNVNGIEGSAGIFMNGFKVGNVTKMEYDPSKSQSITFHLSIKREYKIPANSTARIFNDGLMGGKAIEIVLGDSQQILHRGDTLNSDKDKDLFETAGSDIEMFKQRADDLTREAILAMKNMNEILEANKLYISSAMSNIESISGDMRDVVALERENMKSIISDISTLTNTLQSNADNIDSFIGNMESLSDSMNNSDIIGSLDRSTAELSSILSSISNSEGSLGKLVNDQALYDSLVSATTNLSHLFEDIKENPKRYVNISVFGKKSTAN